MNEEPNNQITFEVETGRILEILSKEIYDSPHALLRENVQNAYDAILMRCTELGEPLSDRSIQVIIEPNKVIIVDDGIGMTEDVLRQNFWKAGSSGKKTELAQRAGVVGTFGIGAMANFGVCTKLRVETRAVGSDITLVSTAIRDELKIGRDCITLDRLQDQRECGTTLIAELDINTHLTYDQGRSYLDNYARFIPLRMTLNGNLVSQHSYESQYTAQIKDCTAVSTKRINDGVYAADLDLRVNPSGTVIARIMHVTLEGSDVPGDLFLVQNGGQLMGYRNYFGLAPVPLSTHYQFGGAANLAILKPTAGREALNRESIEVVNRLVRLAEAAISEAIAATDIADRNTCFQQYIQAHGRIDLAHRIGVDVRPGEVAIPLEEIPKHCAGKRSHYYGGREHSIIQTFASTESCVLNLSQVNPRRSLQQQYITNILKIQEVPDKAICTKVYKGTDLIMAEVAMILRVTMTLAEDYMLPAVEVFFADITHGVAVLVEGNRDSIRIYIARNSSIVHPVLECHRTAYEVFGGFVKDFVRVHLYQRIANFVPSSTREGADALLKLLQRSRELYRYEESEFGQLDPLLADYLSGEATFADVIQAASAAVRPHTQTVTSSQVGRIEDQLPDIVDSPAATPDEVQQQYGAAPPILREDTPSPMKVLLATKAYAQLNGFELFLGLSDRLFKRDSSFFHAPHTTRLIWGSHRVIYIFTHASGEFTLYYDIELKEPLHEQKTGSGGFPTTTIITKDRIYVPVPPDLVDTFRVTEGAKEFYVRFDVL